MQFVPNCIQKAIFQHKYSCQLSNNVQKINSQTNEIQCLFRQQSRRSSCFSNEHVFPFSQSPRLKMKSLSKKKLFLARHHSRPLLAVENPLHLNEKIYHISTLHGEFPSLIAKVKQAPLSKCNEKKVQFPRLPLPIPEQISTTKLQVPAKQSKPTTPTKLRRAVFKAQNQFKQKEILSVKKPYFQQWQIQDQNSFF